MRVAELVMAVVMAAVSVALMVKSTELPIGWIPGEGPGGGAFPFWLSAGMLICCVAVLINWYNKSSPPSRSDDPFMDGHAIKSFVVVAGSLTVMIALIHVIGVYGAVPLYLVFYVRFYGRHSWKITSLLALGMPVVTFFFFEIALRKTLPKGFTEPLFYPLYDIFL